eukprot:3403662-Karenia_brevis.AAC.1
MQELIKENVPKGMWKVDADMDLDTPTKQHVVAFGGDPGTAARRCDKVLGLCRQGKQWRELWALTPAKQQC